MIFLMKSSRKEFPESVTSRVNLAVFVAPNFFTRRTSSCSIGSSLSWEVPRSPQSAIRTIFASVETRTNCTANCIVSARRFNEVFPFAVSSCEPRCAKRMFPLTLNSVTGSADVLVGSSPFAVANLPTVFNIFTSESSLRSRPSSESLPDDIAEFNASSELRISSASFAQIFVALESKRSSLSGTTSQLDPSPRRRSLMIAVSPSSF